MPIDSAGSDSPQTPAKRLRTSISAENQRSELKSLDGTLKPSQNSPSRSACAICFGDDGGRAIRGEIDCCEHFFCFICIVEWSKTESRCPVCRRRFTTIRRPPRLGVFPRERFISVPVRDQASNTSGGADPYAEISCNVCHSAGDDCLLLLCDLCDSASHTYCVGLGATVPEGDWFCLDCSISRAERANVESDTDEDARQVLSRLVAERTRSGVSSDSSRLFSNPLAPKGEASASEVTPLGVAKKKPADPGARTLDRCRSVHGRIRAMRRNWNALRSGSLSFSSSSFEPQGNKEESNGASHLRSGKGESSSSSSRQQSQDQDRFGPYDVDRAWKMMDMAKSKQCAHGKTSFGSSKMLSIKASAAKERAIADANEIIKEEQYRPGSVGIAKMKKPLKHDTLGKEIKKYRSLELEKARQRENIATEAAGSGSYLSTIHSPILFEPSICENITSVGDNICQGNRLMNSARERNGSIRLGKQQTSDNLDLRSEPSTSCSKADVSNGNIILQKEQRHDDTKSEIRSLVKLNLKLLSRDKRLGVKTFREIARLATHTILASCGLEHRNKYAIQSFQSSSCSHIELSHQISKSNMMPKSCQQCFNSFVKNVVSSIMFEKVDCARSR